MIDSYGIERLFRLIRRFSRVQQAKRWPRSVATLKSWSCVTVDEEYFRLWGDTQICGTFEYEVSGAKFQGLIRSVGWDKFLAAKYINGSKPEKIFVRYNPANPAQYRVINADSDPALRFKVAIY